MIAIGAGDAPTVGLLANSALNIPPQDALHYAAQLGKLAVLTELINGGWVEQIDAFDDVSFTPLMWAAKNGNIDTVILLLEAGANVNAHDDKHIAIQFSARLWSRASWN